MVEYIAEVAQDEIEPNLYNTIISDTFNPFGNFAILEIKDQNGERYEEYQRGTRVDIYYQEFSNITSLSVRSGQTYTVDSGTVESHNEVLNSGEILNAGTMQSGGLPRTQRFTGFVVERREYEDNGADILEVELYSFDQFLRGVKVEFDTSGLTIFETLERIITENTPIAWDPAKVSVGDPQTLTRNFRGEKVEDVIIELAFKSENEEFGVDEDLEFFFRTRETTQSPRGIDNTQWFHHDIPEEGKEAVNEVRIYFNGGDESVLVDKSEDKLDTQESLGLESPSEDTLEKTFESITDIDDARDKGEQILQQREAAQTGEVITYGLEESRPGDLIDIQIESRGIDDEFVIAGLEYENATDETTVTIIRKTGYQDEVLVRIADSVEKVEMRPADRDGIENRVTETSIGVLIDVDGDLDGVGYDATRFVNTGRDKARDAWKGDGNLNISEIAVGTDGSNLSRSNTSLQNEVAREPVSESLVGSTDVSYDAIFNQTGIEEVGLFDSDGGLIARCVVDSAVSVDGSVSVSLSVSDDAGISRGVVTDVGQESVRDTLADNEPRLPRKYAYGRDGSLVSESDTALDTVVQQDLLEILVQSIGTNPEWLDAVDIPDDVPLYVEDGTLKQAQTCWIAEGEDVGIGGVIDTDENYSGGEAFGIDRSQGAVTFDFTPDYTVPEDNIVMILREGAYDYNDTINYRVGDDNQNVSISASNEIDWFTFSIFNPGDLVAGESVTVSAEMVDDPGDDLYIVDIIGVYDNRYEPTLDNTVHEPNGYLDSPALFPDLVETELEAVTTRRPVSQAEANQNWNDTTGNQYIELSNDGETFIRTDNNDTAFAEFAEENPAVHTRMGLSNWPTNTDPQNATPRFGYNGQEVSTHNLFADPGGIIPEGPGQSVVLTTIDRNTIVGEDIREAGLLSEDNSLLTRSQLAEFEVLENVRVLSSETITWDNL